MLINELIVENDFKHFIFKKCKNDDLAVSELKKITKKVPNEDGVYFVFRPLDVNRNVDKHLIYYLNNNQYELIYFGKAGGVTSNGKVIRQKLVGRINNVVGENISRAVKWNQVMNENNIDYLTVYYCVVTEPQNFEEKIYSFLKNENLSYPILNKKRGRKPNIIKKTIAK